MSKRNEAIGTVECPTKGCSEQCNVYRFRERGESEKSVANRRFAGKLYARCPKHGTFGGSAGDQEMQEYILCNASMQSAGGERRATTSPEPSKISPPASPVKRPAPAPAKQPSESSTKRSAPRSSPSSGATSTPATTSETPAKKPSGFGFFGLEE